MKEELKEYGLSEKEIEIYLGCLKAGNATANKLSKLTNIRRSTVYEVIESLKKKGLISSVQKDKRLYFSAAKPKTLIRLLKDKEKLISDILPKLTKLMEASVEKPKIELFEGIRGIKSTVSEMLNYKEILGYGASNIADKIMGTYNENFARKRVENKVILKAIIEKDIPEHMKDKKIKKFTQTKTLDFLRDHDSVYFIYGDKVMIITFGEELIAIKIKSKLLVKSQKMVFNFLWKQAK